MAVALTTQILFAQVPSYVPTNGLVGYWPFNGNANDESGNGNNGTVFNATATDNRFNVTGNALLFNGVDSAVELPGNTFPLNNDSYTINLWYRLTTSIPQLNGHTVFDDRDEFNWDYKGRYIIDVATTPTESWYQMSDVGPRIYKYNQPNNTWINITCTYDSQLSKMYLYENGNLINSIDCPSNWYNPGNRKVQIGRCMSPIQYTPGSYFTSHWKGEIDDIAVWNRALTQQEVTNLYNANQCITNITVTDTLIINVGQLSFNDPVTWANNIAIAPNPASSQININFNNITNLNGGTLKVINSLGQEVATTPITTSGTNSTMQLATWGGTGMYFVQIINPQGQIVDIKKIILQ